MAARDGKRAILRGWRVLQLPLRVGLSFRRRQAVDGISSLPHQKYQIAFVLS